MDSTKAETPQSMRYRRRYSAREPLEKAPRPIDDRVDE